MRERERDGKEKHEVTGVYSLPRGSTGKDRKATRIFSPHTVSKRVPGLQRDAESRVFLRPRIGRGDRRGSLHPNEP